MLKLAVTFLKTMDASIHVLILKAAYYKDIVTVSYGSQRSQLLHYIEGLLWYK